MNVLDLFSGIGGFSLGLERAGMRTVAFCEIDPFCRRVLAKHWPHVPVYDDVRTLTAERLRADGIVPDVICGGFPCQDISSSGSKQGISGDDSGLWLEFARLVREIRPRFVIVENVSDLLSRGLAEILGHLASSRYDAEWHSIPASFAGLPQARERVWIVAYPDGWRRQGGAERDCEGPLLVLGNDDDRLALGQHRARNARAWVRRADRGVPNRVDRVKSAGRSAAPQVVEIIGRAIMSTDPSVHRDEVAAHWTPLPMNPTKDNADV